MNLIPLHLWKERTDEMSDLSWSIHVFRHNYFLRTHWIGWSSRVWLLQAYAAAKPGDKLNTHLYWKQNDTIINRQNVSKKKNQNVSPNETHKTPPPAMGSVLSASLERRMRKELVYLQQKTPVGSGQIPENQQSDTPTWIMIVPSGKLLHNYGTIHHFQWENPRTKRPFPIAMLVYQRVTKNMGFPPVPMTRGISHHQNHQPASQWPF